MIYKHFSSLKNIAFFAILVMIFVPVNGQTLDQKSKSDFWNHVRFGGGIGLSFGDGFFSGTLAPSAIYEFNPQFAMGLGLNGTYNTSKNFYKSTVLGFSFITL